MLRSHQFRQSENHAAGTTTGFPCPDRIAADGSLVESAANAQPPEGEGLPLRGFFAFQLGRRALAFAAAAVLLGPQELADEDAQRQADHPEGGRTLPMLEEPIHLTVSHEFADLVDQ